jgi:hypothetical protein
MDDPLGRIKNPRGYSANCSIRDVSVHHPIGDIAARTAIGRNVPGAGSRHYGPASDIEHDARHPGRIVGREVKRGLSHIFNGSKSS